MEASSPPCACGMSSSPHVSELALSATWTPMAYAVYGKRKDGSRVQRIVGYVHAVQHKADRTQKRNTPLRKVKLEKHIAIIKLTGTDDKNVPRFTNYNKCKRQATYCSLLAFDVKSHTGLGVVLLESTARLDAWHRHSGSRRPYSRLARQSPTARRYRLGQETFEPSWRLYQPIQRSPPARCARSTRAACTLSESVPSHGTSCGTSHLQWQAYSRRARYHGMPCLARRASLVVFHQLQSRR